MKISIAYITGRADPKFSWFVDSLANQTTPEQRKDIQLIFVDGLLWDIPSDRLADIQAAGQVNIKSTYCHNMQRRHQLAEIVAGRFDYLHIPEKPCAWKGPFRQTSKDFFCASNARNSAIAAASGDFIACVDDLSILNNIWYSQVQHAAEHSYLVCGSYAKHRKMVVENGVLISSEPFDGGLDSRWPNGSDTGIVPWQGIGLYGCSFGLPMEAALEVDGFDGAGNGQGFEDCDFGARVERAGWAVFYNRNMLSIESEEDHAFGAILQRDSKPVTIDRLPVGYTGDGMSDFVMLHRMRNGTSILPHLGDGLRTIRDHFLATGFVPLPAPDQVDWRNGQSLSEL